MIKIGQTGVAQVLIMALILAGAVAGIYLVQQQTNLFPEAKQNGKAFPVQAKKCLSNADCSAGYECKTKNLKPLPPQACAHGKNPNCIATNSAITNSTATRSAAKREYGTCHKIKIGKVKSPKSSHNSNTASGSGDQGETDTNETGDN